MKKQLLLLGMSALTLSACNQIKDDVKEVQSEVHQVVDNEVIDNEAHDVTPVSDQEDQRDDMKAQDVEVVEEGKDDEGEVVEVIKNDDKSTANFDMEETKEMQEDFKEYTYTLVTKDGNVSEFYPEGNLIAIDDFDEDVLEGYVVRFGENKIGVAARVKDSPTESVTVYDFSDRFMVAEDKQEAYEALSDAVIEAFVKDQLGE